MLRTTPLHDEHRGLGARLVDFSGWEMPIHYGSQLEEHHAVRADAGMFDVAHMAAVDVAGGDAAGFLRHLLANDVAKLTTPGKAIYGCMLNERGGVIDDLITYGFGDRGYRMVVNAGTTDKDLDWLRRHAQDYGVEVLQRTDLGILAVQGPQARQRVHAQLAAALRDQVEALKPFQAAWHEDWFVARTGYTGEDGYEVILPHAALVGLWRALLASGVRPCGLGARDTLRLEAGLNLYGQDMDETVSPLECGLAWTVAWEPADRDFIGRKALDAARGNPPRQQLGLVLEAPGVLRAHMPVRFANGVQGELTSGGFSPTMKRSIALARVGAGASGDCEVQVRSDWKPARVVKPPFVRHGRVLV
jgi:aminomethyltransferase